MGLAVFPGVHTETFKTALRGEWLRRRGACLGYRLLGLCLRGAQRPLVASWWYSQKSGICTPFPSVRPLPILRLSPTPTHPCRPPMFTHPLDVRVTFEFQVTRPRSPLLLICDVASSAEASMNRIIPISQPCDRLALPRRGHLFSLFEETLLDCCSAVFFPSWFGVNNSPSKTERKEISPQRL